LGGVIFHKPKAKVARVIMEQEIPIDLIERLLSLGRENKENLKNEDELIDLLKSSKKYAGGHNHENWQTACEALSRENHILLFKGLVYADILAWGASSSTPANPVFAKLNPRCWPDTVYSLIRWAINVCEYHQFDPGDYEFVRTLGDL